MAIANADGSIVLSTKVDTKGLETGMKGIQGKARAMISTFSKLGGVLASIFSVTAIVNFSKEASNLAIEQEASVQRLIDIYGVASEEVGNFIDLNARALGMSKASAVGFSAVYGNLFSVWADQATNAELTNQYLNMTAVIASKTGRTVEDVQERIRSGLLGNTEAVEDLGVFVNVKTIEMTEAFRSIADGRSWEQLTAYEQSQVRTLAILEQSTKKYGDQVAETNALVRSQYLASYQDLQATWGQLVNAVLMPVLRVATKVMDVLTVGLRIIAGLTGKTIENVSATTSSIGGAVENQEELTDAVKGTNKELKKSLASFDELNTISQDTGSGASSGGGGSTVGAGGGTVGGTPFGTDGGEKAKAEVDAMIAKIMGVVGVGLVAIGLLLCATGHIAWGIGFILAGVATLGITMATLKSNEVSQKVKDALSNVLIITGIVAIIIGILCCVAQKWVVGIGLIVTGAIVVGSVVALNWRGVAEQMQGVFGGVLAVVGLVAIVLGVLCCSAQHWAIGIGLIVTGALAVGSVVAVNFDSIKTILQGKLGVALAIVGIVAIVIGVLCCMAQHWGIGIGYIVVGALVVGSVIALNWDSIKLVLQEHLGKALMIIGIVAIVVGVLCCFTQHWAIGIGLIVSGALAVGGAVAVNWDVIKTQLQGKLGVALAIVGVVAIIIGVLCCFTGNWVLGIGLVVSGALVVGSMAVINWDIIKTQLQGKLGVALAIVGVVAIIIGIFCCFAGNFVLGVGLLILGAGALGITASINWDTIKTQLQDKLGVALAVVGVVAIIIGILCCFTGNFVLGVGLIVLGAGALGITASINWDSIKLALQGPLGRVIAVVGIVAIVLGILICLTGNFALGIGLIVSGGLAVGSVVSLNWDTILEKLKGVWQTIQTWWNTSVAKYFTAEWWGDLAKNAINGFLRWIVNGLNTLVDKLNSFGFYLPSVLGGGRVGFSVSRLSVPQLAKGAVLPPNKPFLAMVGDQKSGTNIEAPLDTIVEAVKIAFGGSNGFSGRVEVPVYLDGRQIAIAIRDAENNLGAQTVTGGFANAY
jgi:hypothetical protein